MEQFRHNDVGDQLVYKVLKCENRTTPLDLSSASGISFTLKRPDGYVYTVTGGLYTNGSDGKLLYTTQSGDFVVTGLWHAQASYMMAGGYFTTPQWEFLVTPLLTD